MKKYNCVRSCAYMAPFSAEAQLRAKNDLFRDIELELHT
jgi:hypothetical protein